MGTRPAGSESRFRRGVAIVTGLVTIGGLAVFASVAGASPPPTVAQVQAKVNQLTSQYDKVTEQLDQAGVGQYAERLQFGLSETGRHVTCFGDRNYTIAAAGIAHHTTSAISHRAASLFIRRIGHPHVKGAL